MIYRGEILRRRVLFLLPALLLPLLVSSCVPSRFLFRRDETTPGSISQVFYDASSNSLEAARGSKRIVCSLADQRLYFFEGDQMVNILRCSTGVNDSTPIGEYHILNHHLTHGVIWGEICDYWLGFTSSHGIHSWPRKAAEDFESELGSPASPGCIVLHPEEAPCT
jgi:lipoprotein-anchoring transpeptidase ErfK/SrfK